MKNKNKHHDTPRRGASHGPSPAPQPAGKPRMKWGLTPGRLQWLTYGAGFLALFAFLCWGYGDVLTRAEQDSYVSTSPDTMQYLLGQPYGRLWWLMRWPLLLFKWTALGAAALALVYTLTAKFTDYALRLPRHWIGLGFLVPLAQVGWILWRGTNLYYKNEPSQFVFIALVCLLATALLAAAAWLLTRRSKHPEVVSVRPYGLALALVLIGGTAWAARHFNENEILTARFQLLTDRADWETIIQEARAARQPSRAVAAYHALALLQTDQLLDGVFDIPYEYPAVRLEQHDGSEEYGLFLADCNLHAGLLNAGYRAAMDHLVMNGPRIFTLKRLVLCSLLNGEQALCRKYLHLLTRVPGEEEFVQKYSAMVGRPQRIAQDPTLAHILTLLPREKKFEQNYQPPAFLGYNMRLEEGTDATLQTSVAACLYSKDLQSFLPRAQVMAAKGMRFPDCMQQALAILALKQPQLLQQFPQVGRFVPDEIRSFLLDAKPYVGDRLRLRHELRDRWLGTYVYYYYTENNDPDQVMKPNSTQQSGVN